LNPRRRRRGLLRRIVAVIARWSWAARLRWRTADKYAALVTIGIATVVMAFAVVLNAVHANKVEQRNLGCLALNVYFEARGEPEAGRYAVAEVTMNRVASPRYPDTVCDVVYEKNWDALRRRYVSAFSWTEFKTRPDPTGADWTRAQKIADEVYHGLRQPKLVGVTHYHASYIRPSWSRHRTPVARIGNHVFYR
jgi:spore germination cell wall hydrolase CwlJ-like protein